MSQVDWSKAPEGATHYIPAMHFPWCKGGAGIWEFWNGSDWQSCEPSRVALASMIERPSTWNGEGLPPVGAVCEFAGGTRCQEDPFDPDLMEGMEVTIIAHFKDGDSDVAAFTFNPRNLSRGNAVVEQGMHGCFRPIRTPEQIAAEEREKAWRYYANNFRETVGVRSSIEARIRGEISMKSFMAGYDAAIATTK